jgi:hypothetical protein
MFIVIWPVVSPGILLPGVIHDLVSVASTKEGLVSDPALQPNSGSE